MSREHISHALRDLLPRLWIFSLRVAGNPGDAEALLRLACPRVFAAPARLGPRTSLPGWFFSVVCRVWLDQARSQPPVRGRAPSAPAASRDHAPEHADVVDAVTCLVGPPRLAFMLVTLEGFSYAEAAEILGVPVDRVKRDLLQARLAIGACVAHPGAGPRPGS
ncbi:RNA polymerase sigma factor [Burkholderia plantarii]|uniref:RNA polymerase sigma factor n=1 Tax=Burkholderia plantarii TaxID=41899 RepID=UPI0008709EF3|nr:RNA polymerase sigma factor [Burkholderia plantarii]WLE62377.1 RNA polymerase sigma factor [Burkholderia plantarii]